MTFCLFHLNLLYSSIEAEQRRDVIQRCYRPLLRLMQWHPRAITIEAPAVTLEMLEELQPDVLSALRHRIAVGECYFVGSGYAQIIGPLAPARTNEANIRHGLEVYENLLGVRPRIAMAPEMALSCGLAALYREAGYEAIIQDVPAGRARRIPTSNHAIGGLPIIWADTIVAQQFARMAHGTISVDDWLLYVSRRHPGGLYCLDAEVFGYRPGRYATEPPIDGDEWERIGYALGRLAGMRYVGTDRHVLTVGAPDVPRPPWAPFIEVGTDAAAPVWVKKQPKYNISRWAVTGRNSVGLNTRCYADRDAPLIAWSSDFRTHITAERWRAEEWETPEIVTRADAGATPVSTARAELRATPGECTRAERAATPEHRTRAESRATPAHTTRAGDHATPGESTRAATRATPDARARSIHRPDLGFGWIPHGTYDDIALAADWYSGHLVIEGMGHRLTDIDEPLPFMRKRVELDSEHVLVEWEFDNDAHDIQPFVSARLGHVTLLPEAWERSSLRFRTHLGGREPENFSLAAGCDHGAPVSAIVSCTTGLGMTEQWLEFEDRKRWLRITVDGARGLGLVTCRTSQCGQLFCRFALSVGESDDTRRLAHKLMLPRRVAVGIGGGLR